MPDETLMTIKDVMCNEVMNLPHREMYEDNDTSYNQVTKRVVQIQTWICVLYGVKQSVNIDF